METKGKVQKTNVGGEGRKKGSPPAGPKEKKRKSNEITNTNADQSPISERR